MTLPTPLAAESSARFRAALETAIETIAEGAVRFDALFPADTTMHGRYPLRPAVGAGRRGENHGWTTSFWTAMVWAAWESTGDEGLRGIARRSTATFVDRMARGVDIDTHDLGFLYSLSAVLADRLDGDSEGRRASLDAADHLMGRVLPAAGIVQAWGDLEDPTQRGRTIIDSLMNMPLLTWAGQQSGDERYARAVDAHVSRLRDHIIRPDGSTFHTFQWDPETGQPLRGGTAQGASRDSCWARGQAWGIYGFAIHARTTGDESFARAAARCAEYFLAHVPADGIPRWDLAYGAESDAPADSSASAIAACGLMELAEATRDAADSARYAEAADRLVTALIDHATPRPPRSSDALVLHGVYDLPGGIGVDEGTLWGDYFFLEALRRRTDTGWTTPW